MKKSTFKNLACAAIAFAVGVGTMAFAACGPKPSGKEGGELTYWAESVGANPKKLAEFVSFFNENNPYGYMLKTELKDSLTSSLREAKKARKGPDIVSFPRWEMATSSSLVKDLSSFIEKSEDVDLAEFNAEAVKEIMYENKPYAIPTDVDAWGIWVNQDMVDDYNEKNPDSKIELPLDTWAEWKEVAQKLTVKEGGAYKTMGFNSEGFRGQMYTMMQTAGVNLVDSSKKPCTMNLPDEEANAVLTFVHDMVFEAGVYAPHTDNIANFYQGKVAMQFGSTGFKQEVDTYVGEDDAMNMTFMGTPARSATQGKVSGIIGGFSFAIPNIASVDDDRSWKAIEWMQSDEAMTKFCELNGVMPAKTELQTDELLSENPAFMTLRELLPTYVTRPAVRGYTTMEVSTLFGEMDKFISGTQDQKTTLSNMISNGNSIFEIANEM